MIPNDIDILRTSIITVLNAFLSWTGWIAFLLVAFEFGRHFISVRTNKVSLKQHIWVSLTQMKTSVRYLVVGYALMFFSYAIADNMARWLLHSCGEYSTPFSTGPFHTLQAWGGLSGLLTVCLLVFGGFAFALSLGRAKWLVGLAQILLILSCTVIFIGSVFVCNLPQG